jgi:hypothetical protein
MAQRYQFINYLDTPVTVHVETQDRIELCQLVDSTPADAPEEPQTQHGPGSFELTIPGGTIFGFFADQPAVVKDPKIANFVIRVANGKVPWPLPPPLQPSLLQHVADFNKRYACFLESAGQEPLRASPDDQPRRAGSVRNVRAILIAGDDLERPGMPSPYATEALKLLENDLRDRFSGGDVIINRPGNASTRTRVLKAFDRMRHIVRGDDLFVVMFAGHGKADVARDTQSWVLTKGESVSDKDLSEALRKFPRSVDIVVISDCCYGEGLFEANDNRVPVDELLQKHSKILGNALYKNCKTCGASDQNSPMVCISAASKQDEVRLANLDDLARETVRAAGAGQSYGQLSEWFVYTKVAGRAFHVDARPDHRMNDQVLGTSSPAITSMVPVPAESPPAMSAIGTLTNTATVDKILSLLELIVTGRRAA